MNYKENMDMVVASIGNLSIGPGLRAIISDKSPNEVLKAITVQQAVQDTEDTEDAAQAKLAGKKDAYKEWSLNRDMTLMNMRDRRNVYVENELARRQLTILAVQECMTKVWQNCDQLDTIQVWRNPDQGSKSWERFKNDLLPMEPIRMYLIRVKPSEKMEDHSLEEFTTMCKEFVKIMSTFSITGHIGYADVEGDSTEWGLYITLRPDPEFMKFAIGCGYKNFQTFIDSN